jgi:hypothetical protein
MSIYEITNQYINGLISEEELQKMIDIENMGSDTTYWTIEELINYIK